MYPTFFTASLILFKLALLLSYSTTAFSILLSIVTAQLAQCIPLIPNISVLMAIYIKSFLSLSNSFLFISPFAYLLFNISNEVSFLLFLDNFIMIHIINIIINIQNNIMKIFP